MCDWSERFKPHLESHLRIFQQECSDQFKNKDGSERGKFRLEHSEKLEDFMIPNVKRKKGVIRRQVSCRL